MEALRPRALDTIPTGILENLFLAGELSEAAVCKINLHAMMRAVQKNSSSNNLKNLKVDQPRLRTPLTRGLTRLANLLPLGGHTPCPHAPSVATCISALCTFKTH